MNCPLCGEPNHCGIKAVKEDQTNCWCFFEKFPQELLQQLPDGQRGKSCICKSCLDAFQASRK
jgi:hypothetical protein